LYKTMMRQSKLPTSELELSYLVIKPKTFRGKFEFRNLQCVTVGC